MPTGQCNSVGAYAAQREPLQAAPYPFSSKPLPELPCQVFSLESPNGEVIFAALSVFSSHSVYASEIMPSINLIEDRAATSSKDQ
jgi:hypothetical protein